mgnify:CR=1 FL=1
MSPRTTWFPAPRDRDWVHARRWTASRDPRAPPDKPRHRDLRGQGRLQHGRRAEGAKTKYERFATAGQNEGRVEKVSPLPPDTVPGRGTCALLPPSASGRCGRVGVHQGAVRLKEVVAFSLILMRPIASRRARRYPEPGSSYRRRPHRRRHAGLCLRLEEPPDRHDHPGRPRARRPSGLHVDRSRLRPTTVAACIQYPGPSSPHRRLAALPLHHAPATAIRIRTPFRRMCVRTSWNRNRDPKQEQPTRSSSPGGMSSR